MEKVINIILIILVLGIILGGALLMMMGNDTNCPGGCVHYFRMK